MFPAEEVWNSASLFHCGQWVEAHSGSTSSDRMSRYIGAEACMRESAVDASRSTDCGEFRMPIGYVKRKVNHARVSLTRIEDTCKRTCSWDFHFDRSHYSLLNAMSEFLKLLGPAETSRLVSKAVLSLASRG
nr:hypothetical protein Iba_chr02eCG1270 [Ipomoea batatas]